MGKSGIGILAALVLAASLIAAPSALAVTPVTCAGLQTAMDNAPAGAVLQLPAGTCLTNIVEDTNTKAFTLQGDPGGGTVLKPESTATPIIESHANVHFTLSRLEFTGATQEPAVFLRGPGEAVKIIGNRFLDNNGGNTFGGAVSIQTFHSPETSQPTIISRNTFTNNRAFSGGAVAALAAPVPLIISHNRFTGNAATSDVGNGGAIYVANEDATTNPVQIIGNVVGGPGGAANTTHAMGAGLYVAIYHKQPLTLRSNRFQNNRITGAHTASPYFPRTGAGLFLTTNYNDGPFPVTQVGNTFKGNVIDETQSSPPSELLTGGAGEWVQGLRVTSVGDRFIGNRVAVNDGSAPEGGGLGVFASAPGTPVPPEPGVFTGTNDLFLGNSTASGGWGGAIYVGGPPPVCTGSCPPSTVTLNDSTIARNRVDPGTGSEGGAIWGSPNDRLRIRNSIVAGNAPRPELWGFASHAPVVKRSDVCSEAGGPPVPGSSAHNLCLDPKLKLGGQETKASPTLDVGSNPLIPAGITTDIAGHPRIRANVERCGHRHKIVDMGAYEFTGLVKRSCG